MTATLTDHLRLLVKLARLYYEDELTQAEIAKKLRLSRQKVQRLLQRAREEGVVQIAIRPLAGNFSDLEKGLEKSFGLREALIISTSAYDQEAVVASEVGAGAAEYLSRVIQPHDKIAISWGASLLPMIDAMAIRQPLEVEGVTVVQALGGLGDPNHDIHAAELVRRLARALRAEAFLLPAPGVASTLAARDAFCNDPQTASVLQRARTATLAFFGIGAPSPDTMSIKHGHIVTWAEISALKERGAVGDMNLHYFDELGRSIASDFDARVIGLNLAEIKKIDHVVGVAGGAVKYKAIRAALTGRLVHVLVTDHVTAQRLLEPSAQRLEAKVS